MFMFQHMWMYRIYFNKYIQAELLCISNVCRTVTVFCITKSSVSQYYIFLKYKYGCYIFKHILVYKTIWIKEHIEIFCLSKDFRLKRSFLIMYKFDIQTCTNTLYKVDGQCGTTNFLLKMNKYFCKEFIFCAC